MPDLSFLQDDAVIVARRLLGCTVTRDLNGQRLIGRIVETEAYHQYDAASHSYKGRTPRTETLFGPPGFLYVYFTYGMHYCMNVVTGSVDEGSAVLIRALEPLEGEAVMRKRRHNAEGPAVTNGPAKLCQALSIDLNMNGHDLRRPPLTLQLLPELPARHIVQTTRIGISRDKERPWRFYIADNPYISRR